MNTWLGFSCTTCGAQQLRDTAVGLCPHCGGILFASYDLAALCRARIGETFKSRRPQLLARWREVMPVADPGSLTCASLGETESPILGYDSIATELGVTSVGFKLDSYLPSGSLKDRPQSAIIAAALERNTPVVTISSSGNAGSALAAHGARAGLQVVVGVFEGVPAAKLAKIRAYAPTLIRVIGGMDATEGVVRKLAERWGWFNAEAFLNPFAIEGEKTIAYEIAAQYDWNPPDTVFLPLGNGACVIAPYKGFDELRKLGLIERIPRLVGVQFDACAPIAKAFAQGREDIEAFHKTPSFSSTLMHEHPISGRLTLKCLRQCGGAAISVSDDEVRVAMEVLAARAGIFAEPAGAIAFAGAARMAAQGSLRPDERIVCLVSGSGMNYIDAAPQGGRVFEPMTPEQISVLELGDIGR